MTQPLIVTQLLLKRAEIEAQIKSLEDRLGQARADLLHVAATVRLFDPTAIDRPATVYHGATKALRRSDLFALCKAALDASSEPLCTRQLARHVITAEGWDMDDARLRLAISHKVGATMKRMSLRGGRAEGGGVAASGGVEIAVTYRRRFATLLCISTDGWHEIAGDTRGEERCRVQQDRWVHRQECY